MLFTTYTYRLGLKAQNAGARDRNTAHQLSHRLEVGTPSHLLFEAVYSKRSDYCASIARSEALISITRPSA